MHTGMHVVSLLDFSMLKDCKIMLGFFVCWFFFFYILPGLDDFSKVTSSKFI